jgi:hypothetical protein
VNRKGIGEAAVMICSKLMSKHSCSRTEGNRDYLRIDPGMSGIRIRIFAARTTSFSISTSITVCEVRSVRRLEHGRVSSVIRSSIEPNLLAIDVTRLM